MEVEVDVEGQGAGLVAGTLVMVRDRVWGGGAWGSLVMNIGCTNWLRV